MRRVGGIAMAWVFATVVAVVIAAAAVSSVRSELTDVPTPLGVSASSAITTAEPEDIPESPDDTSELTTDSARSTASSPSTTEVSKPESTTTRGTESDENVAPQEDPTPEDASTSRPRGQASTPSTEPTASSPGATAPTPTTPTTTRPTDRAAATTTTTIATTTTTTAPPTTSYTRVIDTVGGSLSVRVNGDTIAFRRAYPNSGWRFQLGSSGPDVVEAQFTRSGDTTLRIKVKAAVVDGELKVTRSAIEMADLDT